MDNAAVNFCVDIFMLMYVFISLGYIHRNGIVDNCQAVFQSDSLLYIPVDIKGMRVPISQHLYQHL